MPPSKFEANPTLRLRVKITSFALESSCSNAYFRVYAIIDFLADWLVYLNTVTVTYIDQRTDSSCSIYS